jgi:hypothetical protein
MLANQAFHLQVTQMVSRNDSAGNLAELTSFESGVMTSRLWDLTCERGHKQVSIGLRIPWNTRLGPFWGGRRTSLHCWPPFGLVGDAVLTYCRAGNAGLGPRAVTCPGLSLTFDSTTAVTETHMQQRRNHGWSWNRYVTVF